MDIFINGISCISPQQTFKTNKFLNNIIEYKTSMLQAVEPVYKEIIKPAKLRRMSKIIRMGLVCALDAMQQSNNDMPDAINVGTGLGCVKDTEIFLNKLLDNDEQFLTPTSFINSTHNTIAAQIALWIKCNNQNFTFVHKNSSFEHALLESFLLFTEDDYKNILVGAIDELTEENFNLKKSINLWKTTEISNFELLQSQTQGIIGGEGSAFFVLSDKKTETTFAKLKTVDIVYKFDNDNDIKNHIINLLQRNLLNISDIDFVLYGLNGNHDEDKIYNLLMSELFTQNTSAYFKHLSGEHDSASGFAFWLASMILKNQEIPEICLVDKTKSQKSIKNILIINHNHNKNFTFTLLQQ
ncbi:MAG: 3-oxoacyl-ACP synthase [Bacteroidetes bacterium]|nr:MAG: 3-oxoacyl-ACP synthase [Bacteroidota bacterium]